MSSEEKIIEGTNGVCFCKNLEITEKELGMVEII